MSPDQEPEGEICALRHQPHAWTNPEFGYLPPVVPEGRGVIARTHPLTISLGVTSVLAAELIALSVGAATVPTATVLLEASPQFSYLIFAASVMGFQFWNAGMRALGPARGVLFINLVPVTAFTIALLGGHIPTGWEVLGVGLVMLALVLNSWIPKQKRELVPQSGG